MKSRKSSVLGLTITVLSIALVVGFAYAGSKSQLNGTPAGNSRLGPPPIQIRSFTLLSSIDNARSVVGVDFNLPTNLPQGSSQPEIRASYKSIYVVFDNPNLKSILNYDKAKIVVYIGRDGSSYPTSLDPLSQQPVYVVSENGVNTTHTIQAYVEGANRVKTGTVSGHPAIGYDPYDFSFGHDSGIVEWWIGDVHYEVAGDLPFSSLIPIAESMNT